MVGKNLFSCKFTQKYLNKPRMRRKYKVSKTCLVSDKYHLGEKSVRKTTSKVVVTFEVKEQQ